MRGAGQQTASKTCLRQSYHGGEGQAAGVGVPALPSRSAVAIVPLQGRGSLLYSIVCAY